MLGLGIDYIGKYTGLAVVDCNGPMEEDIKYLLEKHEKKSNNEP